MNTWLINGSSSGLGKSLAKAVLEHREQAIVTARNPENVHQYRECFPKIALLLQLDITKKEKVISSIARCIERFGKKEVVKWKDLSIQTDVTL